MNKICTTREQSQKLIELGIDANAADMWYDKGLGVHPNNIPQVRTFNDDDVIDCYYLYPAWSLSALLDLMPTCVLSVLNKTDGNLYRVVKDTDERKETGFHHNPIDAAFEMVCILLENKEL